MQHLKIGRTILAASLIVLSGVFFLAYRSAQLPTWLTVSVDLALDRAEHESYVNMVMPAVPTVRVSSSNLTYDNVEITKSFANKTSDAYWELKIVLNGSKSASHSWTHFVEPVSDSAGLFQGRVSASFHVSGTFVLWVIITSIRPHQTVVLSTFSEIISVGQKPWSVTDLFSERRN
jgi:hypothetical protein